MRKGKRTLAGVAAGALAIGVMTGIVAPAASAAVSAVFHHHADSGTSGHGRGSLRQGNNELQHRRSVRSSDVHPRWYRVFAAFVQADDTTVSQTVTMTVSPVPISVHRARTHWRTMRPMTRVFR